MAVRLGYNISTMITFKHQSSSILPPTVLTLFGATGNLSLTKLLPTLLHLDIENLLPKDFRFVAVGQREISKQDYLKLLAERGSLDKESLEYLPEFAKRMEYLSINFEKDNAMLPLKNLLDENEPNHKCYNRLYYFATAPRFFEPGAKLLKEAGLLVGCSEHQRSVRVLIEKPFGSDLKSARLLNKTLFHYFSEEQIYRIDHYLGKETVQNLMVMRFANDFLEPIWDTNHIDHIEISVLEESGVSDRIKSYEPIGALKDVVQNHVIQMLTLITMDQPKDLSPTQIRDAKVKVLKALVPFTAKTIKGSVIRGQYVSSENPRDSFVNQVGHPTESETYVAMRTEINNARWKGVPIYLRTGKKLAKSITEISVHFKVQPNNLFQDQMTYPNILSFRIQPNEEVSMQINNKVVGFGMRIHKGSLQFGYKDMFSGEIPGAYQRIFLDFLEGDQRLFIRSDEIEAAWEFIDSITVNWNEKNSPLQDYQARSEGPEGASEMLKRDGRSWWTK